MKLSENLITFIIPVFNNSPYQLKRCIHSIKEQGLKFLEIIIIDDGSTNEQLISLLASIDDTEIKIIRQKNSGSAEARNKGISEASGKYIFFVDADDYISNDFNFEVDIKNDVDVIIFPYFISKKLLSLKLYHDLNKSLLENYKKDILANILYSPNQFSDFSFGSIWSKCFSKKFLNMNNIKFEKKLRKTQDRMFMLDVVMNAKEILYIPLALYHYVENFESITHKINYNMISYYLTLNHVAKKKFLSYNIETYLTKFFTYYIFQEMLLLTYFHKNSKENYLVTKSELNNLYNQFNLYDEFDKIRFSDFPYKKDKVKFYLYSKKLFFILKFFYKIF